MQRKLNLIVVGFNSPSQGDGTLRLMSKLYTKH